jgi:hypothetical protein
MNLGGSHASGALGWADEMDEGKQKDSASGALPEFASYWSSIPAERYRESTKYIRFSSIIIKPPLFCISIILYIKPLIPVD